MTLVQKQFGAHAQNYVTSQAHARGDSLEQLVALLQPQPQWRVLDIATGGGHTALALAPHVCKVVATDVTPEMLTAAEQFAHKRSVTNITFKEADACALPFADAEFDAVTCRIAPHHFADCAQFVRELARVLRPGGWAAVIDNISPPDLSAAKHYNAFEKLRDPSHHWAHTAADWHDFFALTALHVTHAQEFRKALDFDNWVTRMTVAPRTRTQLQVMLLQAPAAARAYLAPQQTGERLTFTLSELLIIGQKGGGDTGD